MCARVTHCSVLIVGAGPVGLLLALALTELGIGVRVIERSATTRHDPRAAIVWPRVAEVLASVGVIDRFEAAACPLRRAEFRVDGRYVGAMELGRLPCAHPYPLMIEQHVTERILVTRLAELGVTVEWQTEALDVTSNGAEARVTVRRAEGAQETIECGWVVGCDGARSLVRAKMGAAFEGAPRVGLECLQVNAAPRWSYPDDRATGYFFVVPKRTLLACPLPTGGYRFVCFTTGEDQREGPPTLEEARDAIVRATGDRDVALTPTEPRWFNRARFQDRVAEALVRGRVLLAGDAAHVWAPVGGHGMNAGMRGAHNLAWKLAAVVRGEAPGTILETYSDEQRAVAHAVIGGITRMKTEDPSPAWVVKLLGAALPYALRAVDRFPRVEGRLTELDAHHRASALSRMAVYTGRLRAGDRLPDVRVRGDRGETRAHELLSLRQWTLFVPSRAASEESMARWRRLTERYRSRVRVEAFHAEGMAAEALDGGGRSLVVRPDAHVGLVARGDDVATVGVYLDAWLARA